MADENRNLVNLKMLLGVSDEKNDICTLILAETEELILNYCNIDEVPAGLNFTFVRMAAAMYRNECPGSDSLPAAVSSVTAGDTSTSFTYGTQTEDYKSGILAVYSKQLNRYRKVRFQ